MHPRRAPFRLPASASPRARPLIAATLVGALTFSPACRREEPRGSATAPAASVAASSDSARPAADDIAAPREPADIAALLARVLALGDTTDADARRRALAELWAGLDTETRANLLEALWATGDEAARARFAELFTHWCAIDAPAAGRWAVELWDEMPGRDGEKLREEAGFAWMKRDFDAAFAWALTLRDVGGEWSLAAKMLKEVALTDPQRALALARGVSDAFYLSALNRIFAGWVEHDPAAAFAELGLACRDSRMFYHHIGKWADRDPVAAVRWAIEQEHASIHSLAGFVKNKGALVAALYEAKIDWSKAAYGRDQVASYLNSWLQADQAGALAWLDALPDSAEKVALLSQGATYRAYDADRRVIPSAAPLIARVADEAQRRDLARQLLTEWGRSDPEAALKWSLELDDPALHEAALVSAVAGLAKLDVSDARAQLDTLPAGPARAQANLNLALGWSEASGAEALDWLNGTQPNWADESWRPDDMTGRVILLRNALNAKPVAVAEWANTFAENAPAWYLTGNAIVNLGAEPPWGGGEPLKAVAALETLQPAARRLFLGNARSQILRGERGAEARAQIESSTRFTAEEKALLLGTK